MRSAAPSVIGVPWLLSCGPGAAPVAKELAPATVRFTVWGVEAEEVPLWTGIFDAFHARVPQITIANETTTEGSPAYHQKLIVQQASGAAPDVGAVASQMVPAFGKQGLLRPLDDRIKADRYDLSDFFQPVLSLGRYRQALYTLPLTGGPNPVHWNARPFREAGLPLPAEVDARGQWTWEGFLDAARRTTRREGDVFRSAGFSPTLSWTGLASWLWSAGADYFNADRTKCTINDPAGIEAVQFVADLYLKHEVYPRPGTSAAGLQWTPNGNIAMQIAPITTAWAWRRDPTFDFDITLPPKGKAAQIGLLNGNGYGVIAGSNAEPAAWEFLKYLVGPETVSTFAFVGRSFPWRKAIATSREYRDKQPFKNLDVLFKLGDKNGKTYPTVPAWDQIQTFANEHFSQMARGSLGVREGLDRIKTEADRLLAG